MQALFRAEIQSFLSVPGLQLTKSAGRSQIGIEPINIVDVRRGSPLHLAFLAARRRAFLSSPGINRDSLQFRRRQF
jgi:hypothetical protein